LAPSLDFLERFAQMEAGEFGARLRDRVVRIVGLDFGDFPTPELDAGQDVVRPGASVHVDAVGTFGYRVHGTE
jgi:hypothetical protein